MRTNPSAHRHCLSLPGIVTALQRKVQKPSLKTKRNLKISLCVTPTHTAAAAPSPLLQLVSVSVSISFSISFSFLLTCLLAYLLTCLLACTQNSVSHARDKTRAYKYLFITQLSSVSNSNSYSIFPAHLRFGSAEKPLHFQGFFLCFLNRF